MHICISTHPNTGSTARVAEEAAPRGAARGGTRHLRKAPRARPALPGVYLRLIYMCITQL